MLPSAALALALGAASFYAVSERWVVFPALSGEEGAAPAAPGPEPDEIALAPSGDADAPAFVGLEPFVISLGGEAKASHLRVVLQIETSPAQADDVARLTPRLRDVLNIFLRAVDERDLANPRAMARLRAQMLRRVRLVAPEGSVRDLLIQDFVLN